MKIALFLHIYQPPTQFPSVVRRITENSYLRFTEIVEGIPSAKITLNLVGSLTQQLKMLGDDKLLHRWADLHKKGQIEFTGTAAYHPLLTKLPADQVRRQIELNSQINRKALGKYAPSGFFPPEMVYNHDVGTTVAAMGYQWIVLDESAHPLAVLKPVNKTARGTKGLGKKTYSLAGSTARVLFRDRTMSLTIAFSQKLALHRYLGELRKRYGNEDYVLLAMDGETFGHHHPELLSFLRGFLSSSDCEFTTVSELLGEYPEQQINPVTSTWGVTLEHSGRRVFPRWDNPRNPVHGLKWQLFDLAVQVGAGSRMQSLLDQAVHADEFCWATPNPWWYSEMVRRGARGLVLAGTER